MAENESEKLNILTARINKLVFRIQNKYGNERCNPYVIAEDNKIKIESLSYLAFYKKYRTKAKGIAVKKFFGKKIISICIDGFGVTDLKEKDFIITYLIGHILLSNDEDRISKIIGLYKDVYLKPEFFPIKDQACLLFARNLILPCKEFCAESNNYASSQKQIEHLSEIFNVTSDIIEYRANELGVPLKNGIIKEKKHKKSIDSLDLTIPDLV